MARDIEQFFQKLLAKCVSIFLLVNSLFDSLAYLLTGSFIPWRLVSVLQCKFWIVASPCEVKLVSTPALCSAGGFLLFTGMFILLWPRLLIVLVNSCAFLFDKSLPTSMLWRLVFMFSSGSCSIKDFKLRLLIHLELIFAQGGRHESNLILLQVEIPTSTIC